MEKIVKRLFVLAISLSVSVVVYSQNLTDNDIESIKKEVNVLFENSVHFGEIVDIDGFSDSVNDTFNAGFIENGYYYKTFDELMVGYKERVQGLLSQDIQVIEKRITVLSANTVLLTAAGDYSANIDDGRILTGKFFWTFVYSKINDEWKVIHSHMSNP